MGKNNKIRDINEYKKKKKNKHKNIRLRKIKRRLLKISLVVMAFASIIINICGYAVIGELKYEIGSLEDNLRKEEVKLEGAKAKLGAEMSIQEIEKRSKEELNMDYPAKDQIRYIQIKE